MKPRRGKLIAIILFLTALLVSVLALRKPALEEWYLRRLESQDESVRRNAALRLGELGCYRSMPRLVRLYFVEEDFFLNDGEAGRESSFSRALEDLSGPEAIPYLEEFLTDRSNHANIRAWAARRLASYPRNREALAILGKGIGDPEEMVRVQVIMSLPGFRHLAVPLLLEAMGDEDDRENALWHLSSLGPLAKGAVPALLEEGKEKDAVAFALERIGWDFGGKPAREDPGITPQDEAPKNLSKMGSPELPADPKRIRKLKEDLRNPDLRLAAVDSLGRIGPGGLPPLLDLLRLPDIDQELGRRIKSHLDFRYSDVRALPILVETLEHPDPEVREWAASCLGELGPRAAPAVDTLVRCLSDRETREHAMAALGRIGPGAAGAIEALEEDLLDAEETDSAWALSKMEGMGLPPLLRAASHSSPTVRAAALLAFGSMGRNAGPAVDALIRALEDREPTAFVAFRPAGVIPFFDPLPMLPVGAAAASALEELGPLAMEAVPALVEALGSESVWISIAASRALGVMGPGAAPALERALADPREDVRGLAAFALGRIGPGAGAAIPALRRCLTDESDYVRICAAEALGRMGPEAGEALPALRELAEEGSKALRVHARLAVRKIEGN